MQLLAHVLPCLAEQQSLQHAASMRECITSCTPLPGCRALLCVFCQSGGVPGGPGAEPGRARRGGVNRRAAHAERAGGGEPPAHRPPPVCPGEATPLLTSTGSMQKHRLAALGRMIVGSAVRRDIPFVLATGPLCLRQVWMRVTDIRSTGSLQSMLRLRHPPGAGEG